MKRINTLAIALALSTLATSCTNMESLEFHVEKPESYLDQEAINQYAPLKDYINRTENPDFKLGAGAGLQDYASKSVMYRLLNSNFDEITMGSEMKHMAVVNAQGNLVLDDISRLLETSRASGMSIFGHTLCWHANQNASYLNSLIAPLVIPGEGEPGWVSVIDVDFETDDEEHYEYTSNAKIEKTTGRDGTGLALKLTNETVGANDWDCQFFLKFSPVVKVGEQYELSMDIRSDAAASYSTQAHTTPYNYKHWDFFGSISSTPTWETFTKTITITSDMADAGAVAFNLGNSATSYYFDNITLKKYDDSGTDQIIEKTPEEKYDLIYGALEKWISEMVTHCKDDVRAWDVLNEPMSDWPDVYELKTGIGRTDLAEDEFYWQDYLGYDYGAFAFKLARQYGNEDDIHFINDYGLEYNLDKCKGLIQYMNHIESKGARVDGIGTQMHIGLEIDRQNIIESFKLLAATGKMIKVSELDIGLGPDITNATPELLEQQSELYKFVVQAYMEFIPAKQRYGITLWSPTDSPENSSWRAGEPIGIWNLNLIRKPAYRGVADGLAGNE